MFDYHVHTQFSPDSKISLESLMETSIKTGVKEIAITDHIDFIPNGLSFDCHFDYEEYKEKIQDLISKTNNLNIKIGVELGIQSHLIEKCKQYLEGKEFDFIIASIHAVDGFDLYKEEYYKGKSKEESYTRYFEEVYNCIAQFDKFNVLGHLDIVRRYGQYHDKSIKYHNYSDIIDQIFKILIYAGKGIEVNTSSSRYNLDITMPNPEFLRRYKELGGEIITIGSDAHSIEHLCFKFHETIEILKSIGFKYITLFSKNKPIFVSLEKI